MALPQNKTRETDSEEKYGDRSREKITAKHSTNIWSMKFMAVARLNPQMNWIYV